MKIKRLEIQGFKSFADRTVLHFGDGITGILGPNGCGKSNVVDAIKWTMGEQSAKQLRGGAMDDVIFSGSSTRGPMGMAEVTITFKNDGNLVPPEYQHLSEISVTRRLFRDGTSEYCLNKQPCLLRDINDLFMGTGIGRNSYAIIEQGRIGLVVTARPEDRRALIEDAAGISKYKARRKQAERKLEAAEQNLLRVSDIVTELKKRLDSLERQAKKAEKYKELKAELRELDLCAAVHRHLELSALEHLEAEAVDAAKRELGDREQALGDEEGEVLARMEALDAAERDLRAKEARLRELEQALAVGAKNVEHYRRELEGLETRRGDAERERGALAEQLAEAQAEAQELEATALALGTSGGQEAERLERELATLTEIEDEIRGMEAQLERHKQVLVECLTKIAQHENNLANLEKRAGELDERLTRVSGERAVAEQSAKSCEKDAAEKTARLDDNRQLKLALQDRKTAQEGVLERYQAEFVQNEAQLLGLREELFDKRSRLSSLEEIRRNYEGCGDGVRAVMRRRESDPTFKRVHGLVADVLSAEPRLETAVEAVLGERLQYVIVHSQEDGVRSVDFLKTSADGRGSFIPLDLREDHVSWAPRRSSRPPGSSISDRPPPQEILDAADAARAEVAARKAGDVAAAMSALPVPELAFDEEDLWPNLQAEGVLGKMVDLVDAAPGFEQVARVLLGDVVVVEELEHARSIWHENGHRKTLVTLAGEVLDPVGVLTGGSTEGVSAGMLAKKREIHELEISVQGLEARVKMAEDRHKTLKAQIATAEQAIVALSADSHKEDLSILELEKDVRSLQANAAQHAERRLALGRELEKIERSHNEALAELDASRRAIEQLEARRDEAKERVTASTHALNATKVLAQERGSSITALKVAVAATVEKRESSERSMTRVRARIADVEARISKLGANITQSGDEGERLRRAIADGATEGEDLALDIERRTDELGALTASHEEAAAALKDDDARIRRRRAELDALKDAATAATMRHREHQLAKLALHEQIADRYQLALVDSVFDYHLSPLLGEESAELRAELRRKIDRMGEINLTAIKEFAEVDERHRFLSEQQTDLRTAINALKAAIKKIDVKSKERFLEAFELVNEKFKLVFPRLFNGGRAELVLADPDNPLEAGIELLAQPPGKNLQSVNLLSGGEKALTAISLIFGIFLIKPTPFCLLDEVDAPLDDANVGRYNDMVRDMSQISQFILITHNKRTMEIPDRLYGVTMQEPGISKLVGVDLRSANNEEPPPLEEAAS